MENKKELSTKQNIISVTISSLSMIGLYSGGITLARNTPEYHNPIFMGTIFLSVVTPYVLNSTTTYVMKKYNQKKKNKQLKK